MKFGSLFSGIGGLDLGLERAGMTCAWQCEIDEHCRRILAKHWPTVRRLADVRDVSASTVEAVDLVCGGFPCQPVSAAGKRQGASDLRWLWPEYARVLDEIRPQWALLENVPGLLTVEDGAGALVAADLASLGYDAEWGCISASAFGSPYRRSRWFCVAYLGCESGRTDRTEPRKNQPRENVHDQRCHSYGPNNDGDRFSWGTQTGFQSFLSEFESSRWGNFERCGENGTDVASIGRREGGAEPERQQGRHNGTGVSSHADEQRLPQRQSQPSNDAEERSPFVGTGWWAAEPDVVRVVSGFPNRVDRIRGLGNAVIPIAAQFIGQSILAAAKSP